MRYRGIAALGIFVICLMTIDHCRAAGALAVGQPSDIAKDGVAIFTQVGSKDADEAKKNALAGCKNLANASQTSKDLCKIVATFRNQCVAAALDPQDGTPGFAWAMAPNSKEARENAVSNCRDTAGPTRQDACVVRPRSLWCDGSAK